MTIGLGRIHAPDDRDRRFALARPRAAAGVEKRYWITTGDAYDQGGTSQCVSYAWQRYLTTSPIKNEAQPFEAFYVECQRNDEWPGEEPEYFGTSVRAGAKVMRSRGLIGEYRWCWDAQTALDHLLAIGPLVLGTDWHWEMFQTDRWGYIQPSGSIEGGHAYCVIGANRSRRNPDGSTGAVRLINSWGPGWGQRGRAWLTMAHFDQLIRVDGECCAAIEVKQ